MTSAEADSVEPNEHVGPYVYETNWFLMSENNLLAIKFTIMYKTSFRVTKINLSKVQ